MNAQFMNCDRVGLTELCYLKNVAQDKYVGPNTFFAGLGSTLANAKHCGASLSEFIGCQQ